MINWYVRRGYTKTDRREPYLTAPVRSAKGMKGDLYFVIMEKEL
jgi:hypothetical protein